MTSIDISNQRVSDWSGFLGDFGGEEVFHTTFEACPIATAANALIAYVYASH